MTRRVGVVAAIDAISDLTATGEYESPQQPLAARWTYYEHGSEGIRLDLLRRHRCKAAIMAGDRTREIAIGSLRVVYQYNRGLL